jgi:hypothetical protein
VREANIPTAIREPIVGNSSFSLGYENRFIVEPDQTLAHTKILPQIELLAFQKQSQSPH